MGLLIVIIVGGVFGWLVSIMIERDDRIGADICAIAGIIGAVMGADLSGRVPLLTGVTPAQLLWAVLGASIAIIVSNAAWLSRPGRNQRNV